MKNNNKLVASGLLCAALLLQTGFASAAIKSELHKRDTAELEASLGMLDKNKVDVVVRIPASQAYGFSDKAATPEQRAQVNTVVDNLRKDMPQLVSIKDATDCTYDISSVDTYDDLTEKRAVNKHGKTEDMKYKYTALKAEVTIKCGEDLRGKVLSYNLSPDFKDVKNVYVVLSGSENRSFLAKPNGSFNL